MERPTKVTIIIPVYNEEQYIEKTLISVLESNTERLQKEIILIDDGSKDKTLSIIHAFFEKKAKKVHKPSGKLSKFSLTTYVLKKDEIHVLHKKNEGKGSALKIGFLQSTGDIVLVQDADLEYNPDEYPRLLEPFLTNKADVVYGSRFISDRPHRVLYFWHAIANRFLTLFSNMMTNLNLTDMETGYKAFKGDIIRSIAPQLQTKQFGFEPEITARLSKIKDIQIFEVGISYWGRTYSEGKKIGWKDGVRAVWEIINYNLYEK